MVRRKTSARISNPMNFAAVSCVNIDARCEGSIQCMGWITSSVHVHLQFCLFQATIPMHIVCMDPFMVLVAFTRFPAQVSTLWGTLHTEVPGGEDMKCR